VGGGHHLHWTALPDWTSSLAAAFHPLLMPSWGGMMQRHHDAVRCLGQMRTDPVMRFMIVALSFLRHVDL